MTAVPVPVLTRVRQDRAIAGVCAGLARYLGLPVAWVRLGVVGLSLISGVGVVFYAWLWIFVPDEGEAAVDAGAPVRGAPEQARPVPAARPAGSRHGPMGRGWQVVLGTVLLGLAGALTLQVVAGVGLNWGILGPATVVLLGVALVWLQYDALRGAAGRPSSSSI